MDGVAIALLDRYSAANEADNVVKEGCKMATEGRESQNTTYYDAEQGKKNNNFTNGMVLIYVWSRRF